MTNVDARSTAQQLMQLRDELFPQPRTVSHQMMLATDKQHWPDPPMHQHLRRVPSAWGARRDLFCWDSWDWSVQGELNLRSFLEIARKITRALNDQPVSEINALLPGTLADCQGICTRLYWGDYWLLVIHHLGWSELLPYDCVLHWRMGQSFEDDPFCVSSRLPVNIVQASIDALTVLIDAAMTPSDFEPHPEVGETSEFPNLVKSGVEPRPTVNRPQSSPPRDRPYRRPARKRADRAANIEALKQALVAHIHSARDHAQAAIDFGREPDLLPRPSRRQLAQQVGITESAASRCFSDTSATELNLLWRTSDNLEAILQFVRP